MRRGRLGWGGLRIEECERIEKRKRRSEIWDGVEEEYRRRRLRLGW